MFVDNHEFFKLLFCSGVGNPFAITGHINGGLLLAGCKNN